jgi:hypothetical protein
MDLKVAAAQMAWEGAGPLRLPLTARADEPTFHHP